MILAVMMIMTTAVRKTIMKIMTICMSRTTGAGANKLPFWRISTF